MLKRILEASFISVLVLLFVGLSTLTALTANLRFSHATHNRHNIPCETCHIISADTEPGLPPGWKPLRPAKILNHKSDASTDSQETASETSSFGRPPEKICLKCHLGAKQKKDCGLCHLGHPTKTERERKRVRFGAKFSHESHKNFDCLDCHPKIGDWETLDGSMVDTSMKKCLSCHNKDKAKNTCTMCHAKTPWPSDHTRNYEKKHGVAYRSDPQACRMCHEDSTCIACHAKRPRYHTLVWVTRRHAISAQSNPDKCFACHRTQETCARCHAARK